MISSSIRVLSNFKEKKVLLRNIFALRKLWLISSVNYTACGRGTDFLNKFTLPERLASLDKNVWVEYIDLVNKYKPINLGQGFPDYMPPDMLVKALEDVTQSDNGLLHQYTRSFGHPRLVNAIAKFYSSLIQIDINPMTDILIGIGATEVLFSAFLGHLQPGDEAIIIEPFYDCYSPMIKLTGATPVFIPLQKKPKTKGLTTHDWILDSEQLSKMFNEKTKVILINSPHNPIGKVFTEEELTFIAELCKKWNVLCISDEVYEWMVYKPNAHIRMATIPDMWDRTITVGSAGKSFSVTGWKIGWAYGPAKLMRNLQVVHQYCVYTCSTVLQEAVAVAFEREIETCGMPESYFERVKSELEPKRDYMVNLLKDVGMKPIVPEGGYFVLADWTPLESKIDLSGEKDKEKDYRFTKWLTKKVGVLGIPPSAFYSEPHKKLGENYVRFCFTKKDENLKRASDRLKKWRSTIR